MSFFSPQLVQPRSRKIISPKIRKSVGRMAPGVRNSKRVRASTQSDVQPSESETRASKRLLLHDPTAPYDVNQAAEESNGPAVDENTPSEDGSVSAGHDNAALEAHNGAANDDNSLTEGPQQRAPRRPRPPTVGKQLDRMTKAMGRRLPIVIKDGKKRPQEPVQAAKLASEAGVIIRQSIPVLPHWKDYKKDDVHYKAFEGQLAGRLAINTNHAPTREAMTDLMRVAIKNQRYRLKKRYFNGVPANQISTTSPVRYMTDVEWRALVAKWSDPKNMQTCEKNKENRSKVKYHQATGSRFYVAHLHAYKQTRILDEPSLDQAADVDAVEAFETCHTSSKRGLSDPAREALSQMEALRTEPVPEGEMPASSVQVVSKVLSQNSSNLFLKSVGFQTPPSSKSGESNESELREQLAAEATAAVQGELDDLRKKIQDAEEDRARTQKELEEYKKLTEKNSQEMAETNLILKKLLSLHGNASSST